VSVADTGAGESRGDFGWGLVSTVWVFSDDFSGRPVADDLNPFGFTAVALGVFAAFPDKFVADGEDVCGLWKGGFCANVTVERLGDIIDGVMFQNMVKRLKNNVDRFGLFAESVENFKALDQVFRNRFRPEVSGFRGTIRDCVFRLHRLGR